MKNEIKALAKSIGTKMGKKRKITDEVILSFLSHYIEKELASKIDEITIEYDPSILISQAIKDNNLAVFKKLTQKTIAVYIVVEVIYYSRQNMFDYLKTTHDLTPMHEQILNSALERQNNEIVHEMILSDSKHLQTIENIFKKLSNEAEVNRMSRSQLNEMISNEWLMDYLIFEHKITLPANMIETMGTDTNLIASLLEKIAKRDLFLSLDEDLVGNTKVGKMAKI